MDSTVLVVGAGILGLATARELLARQPDRRVIVLEREPEVGFHQTGHNSGVIHGGIYYAPGSLKARLCVRGAREMYEFCEQHGIEARRCGKLIVATREEELPGLDELERRATANEVPGLRRIGAAEIQEIEPHARGIAALHSPATGVVDFRAVARALADDVGAAGGELRLGWDVAAVDARNGDVRLRSRGGDEVAADTAVFCAGGWSDRLARDAGAGEDPRIVPFRGAYLTLRPERAGLVKSLIYPVPDPTLPFLGVHLSRHVDDEVTVGPTALLAATRDPRRRLSLADVAATLSWPGSWKMMRRWWRTGLTELKHAVSTRTLVREAQRYVPELEPDDVQPGHSGIRAQALARDGRLIDDFVFDQTGRVLHVRNAPSPGATASLAIAREIA
ncbi:MAG TPA: L-2-hydroxyglutarate oxidase, partial [Thermoleophilaceae bacterium]|nr:L-2-hydroxyglutarate oxidase [Thermoleophilaceae bacterium]